MKINCTKSMRINPREIPVGELNTMMQAVGEKTTFTNQVLRHEWSEGCLFINPDEIAKYEFGDWNFPDAVMKAAVRSEELREECLIQRKDLLWKLYSLSLKNSTL